MIKVGNDGGVFSAGYEGMGNLWKDEEHDSNIETVIVIEYDWF